MPSGRINTIIELIKQNHSLICVEVGVWKGDLSFILLKECKIKKYFMVDPLTEDVNNFSYSSKNNDFPNVMSNNKYICNMGGKTLGQLELDNVYNNIIKKINNNPNISFLREESKSASEKFENESLDFVFIDAIHLYDNVKEDINLWLPKVKKGGILAGDDYSNDFPGVIKAVNEIFNNKQTVKNTIWSVKK